MIAAKKTLNGRERKEWEQHTMEGGVVGGRKAFLSKEEAVSFQSIHGENISYLFKGCTKEAFWWEIQHLHESLRELSACVSLFLHGKIPGSSCVVWKTIGVHSQCGYVFHRYRIGLLTLAFPFTQREFVPCQRQRLLSRVRKMGSRGQKKPARTPALFL